MHMFVDLTLKISCNFTGLEVKVNYIKRAVWGVSENYKLLKWSHASINWDLEELHVWSLWVFWGEKKSPKWPKISQSVLKLWPHQPGTASGLQHINWCRIFYTGFPDLSGCTVPPGQDRRPDKRCGSEAESKQNDLACLMVFTQQLDNRSSRRYQLKPSALDRCHPSVTDSFIFCTGGDLIGLFLPNEP